MSTSVVKLVLDEEVLELDLSRIMMTEAIALEEEWNIASVDFLSAVGQDRPPLKAVLAMVWLAKARKVAAEAGVPFAEAARQVPASGFDFDVTAFRIDAAPEPENPTHGGTRTKGTRTTRTTSAGKRAKTA